MADVRLFWALHLVLVTVGTAYLVCLAGWGITHSDLAPHQRSSSVPEWFGRGPGCHSAAGCAEHPAAGHGFAVHPGADHSSAVHAAAGRSRRRLIESGTGSALSLALAPAAAVDATQTLSFSVCNGFANQRLALLNAMVLAKALGRAVVLPQLITDGRQDEMATNYGSPATTADFSTFYDRARFVEHMAGLGVAVVREVPPGSSTARVAERDTEAALRQRWRPEDHLQFGCPLLRLGPDVMAAHEDLVFGVFAALAPAAPLAAAVNRTVATLHGLPGGRAFNFLHLRLESDWIAHCERFRPGQASDNCFTNTLDIARHLRLKGMGTEAPLFVAFDAGAVLRPVLAHVLEGLASAGYAVVTQRDLPHFHSMPREVSALVEYGVAMAAAKFVGNSVSTFSALAILERRRAGAWATWYNMGDVPLAAFLPFYPMPWVFTYNSAASAAGLDYMVKAAVVSARSIAHLVPYCLYNGTDRDTMYRWLRVQGVAVQLHTPAWAPRMAAAYPAAAANARWSPLYNSLESLVGTYQRLDIPLMPALEQFNYVLFTDADVLFQRPISLESFGQPLPRAVAMAFEQDDTFPCNAGVMLLNLPRLRETHAAFVHFALSKPGLYHEGYGPGDQGAYNEFYAADMGRACVLPEAFNAKPYKNGAIRRPYIAHFHGPKPLDYVRWRDSGLCAGFGRLCARGFCTACRLMREQQRLGGYLPTCQSAESS